MGYSSEQIHPEQRVNDQYAKPEAFFCAPFKTHFSWSYVFTEYPQITRTYIPSMRISSASKPPRPPSNETVSRSGSVRTNPTAPSYSPSNSSARTPAAISGTNVAENASRAECVSRIGRIETPCRIEDIDYWTHRYTELRATVLLRYRTYLGCC